MSWLCNAVGGEIVIPNEPVLQAVPCSWAMWLTLHPPGRFGQQPACLLRHGIERNVELRPDQPGAGVYASMERLGEMARMDTCAETIPWGGPRLVILTIDLDDGFRVWVDGKEPQDGYAIREAGFGDPPPPDGPIRLLSNRNGDGTPYVEIAELACWSVVLPAVMRAWLQSGRRATTLPCGLVENWRFLGNKPVENGLVRGIPAEVKGLTPVPHPEVIVE